MYTNMLSDKMREALEEIATHGGSSTKLLLHVLFEFITMDLSKDEISQGHISPAAEYVF